MKHVTPADLSKLITILLLTPESVGHLDTRTQYIDFLTDLGQVVTRHCGGSIAGFTNGSSLPLASNPIDHLPVLEVNAEDVVAEDIWSLIASGSGTCGRITDYSLHVNLFSLVVKFWFDRVSVESLLTMAECLLAETNSTRRSCFNQVI